MRTSRRPIRRGYTMAFVCSLRRPAGVVISLLMALQGSYAGARAAHMRVLYPDLVFGAIASSGTHHNLSSFTCDIHPSNPFSFLAVTHAVLINWEYMDVIRLAADPKCSSNLVNSITTIDSLLKFAPLRRRLKKLFGLDELESDKDFVSVLTVCLSPVYEISRTNTCWWNSIRWPRGRIGTGTLPLARRRSISSAQH